MEKPLTKDAMNISIEWVEVLPLERLLNFQSLVNV